MKIDLARQKLRFEENSDNRSRKLVLRSKDTNSFTYRYYWRTIDFLLKLPKTSFLAVRAHFRLFEEIRKTTPDFFDEKFKTGLGFEIEQSQRKCQHRPTL